ncbi:MAG: ABC transporter permease [Chloroflexi bacterium]|nr:ABC transporter permease [Chloroflexota bacterium]
MSELTAIGVLLGIIHQGIRLATPYLYAAIGETISQRAGVFNLGVEGIMLMGAFSGFYAVFETGNLLLGVLAAAVVGLLMGLLMSVVSITFHAEQGISGIGLYMFGLGASSLLFKTMLGTIEPVRGFPALRFCLSDDFCLANISVIGDIFFGYTALTYGAYLLVPIVWWVLNRTTWGLKIRAVGHNPEAADSLGVSVTAVRYASVMIGSMLAGVAGASLSIGLLNVFQEEMTNGIGFIAVALVYFGSWKPVGVLGGALLFAGVSALQLWVQVINLEIPSDLAVMLPYLLTIIALALPFRRSLQPGALGKPFSRGEG